MVLQKCLLVATLAGAHVCFAADKVWTGAQNGVWDTQTENWLDGSVPAAFSAGDNASFGGSATCRDVSVSGSQTAGKVVFDSDADYTLTSEANTQSTETGVGLSGAATVEKRGSGTLTVNGMHGFSGDLRIYGGIYRVGSGATDKGAARNSPIGDPRTARTITVYTNATLQLAATGVFGAGTASSDVLADLEIRGGTLAFANSTCTAVGSLLLHNATMTYNGGAGNWPLLCMTGHYLSFVSDDPTKPYVLPANGNNCGLFLSRARPIDIRVPDITGDDAPDVVLGVPFKDVIYDSGNTGGWCSGGKWNCTTNFVKTGAGTLSISNIDNNIVRDIVVSNGTLRVDVGKARIGADTKNTPLGNTYDAARTITVEKGATLAFNKSDIFGQFFHDPSVSVKVRGGKLKLAKNTTNSLGPLVLEDATVECNGQTQGWPTIGFSTVTFCGTKAMALEAPDGHFAICRHLVANGDVTSRPGELCVSNIVSGGVYTGTPDVTIASAVKDVVNSWNDYNKSGRLATQFRKTGTGVLRMGYGWSEFTGDVTVSGGVMAMAKAGAQEDTEKTPLGNLMSGKRIAVTDGAELYFSDSDQFGQMGADYDATLVVSNATLRFASGTANGLPELDLFNPTFEYGDGAWKWGVLGLRYKATFDGTGPISLPSTYRGVISLGYSSDYSVEAGATNIIHGKTELCIRDITGDPRTDVDIGLDIQSLPWWDKTSSKHYNDRFRCGLLKTGAGTLRLYGAFRCPEETRINEGTLQFDGKIAEQESGWGKSTMRVQSGAYLSGTGTVAAVVIEAGGGFSSTVGQTRPLVCGTVSVPDGTVVPLNVVGDRELQTGERICAPIVKASAGLDGVTYEVLYNGRQPTSEYRVKAYVENGVVYGCVSRPKGLVLVVR